MLYILFSATYMQQHMNAMFTETAIADNVQKLNIYKKNKYNQPRIFHLRHRKSKPNHPGLFFILQ